MCNGLYWVCTHSGNMDDENMNVLLFFLQIIMSLVKVSILCEQDWRTDTPLWGASVDNRRFRQRPIHPNLLATIGQK